MSTLQSLPSLNHDIFQEIPAHLLLDTPSTANRSPILRTCSLLQELELELELLPLLYQVVDLRNLQYDFALTSSLATIFYNGGLEAARKRRVRGRAQDRLWKEGAAMSHDRTAACQRRSLQSLSTKMKQSWHRSGCPHTIRVSPLRWHRRKARPPEIPLPHHPHPTPPLRSAHPSGVD